MGKYSLSAVGRILIALPFLMWATAAFGQAVPAGWMDGAQSPGFPTLLPGTPVNNVPGPAVQSSTPQGQPSSPQSLPGQTPTTPQPNAATGQAPAAGPTASDWTLLKEVQAGIAAATP